MTNPLLPGLISQGTSSLTQTINTPILYAALNSGNPIAAVQAATLAAQQTYTPDTTIVVTVYDKYYNFVGSLDDYKKLDITWERNATGTALITLKQDDPLVSTVMSCWNTRIPITFQSGALRWSGQIEYVDYSFKDGEYNVDVYCTDDYQYFDKIMVFPDPFLPIQIQFPSEALFIGPAITCIKTMIAENCFRLQSGIWELIDNALSGDFNWEAWFGTLLESNGNLTEMLITPIAVVFTDPLFDTSPWISLEGRMDKVSTLVGQALKDAGLLLTANLWLPGEPQPAGMIIPLTAPTIVVDCKDMSGITGPTGTFIDGLVKDVVDLQATILGNVLQPLLNPGNLYAPEGINIAPALGVNFNAPWVLFTDHPRGGLREFHLIPHTPLAYTVIGGGKSPQWINDLINIMLEWLIDSIEIAIGLTGIPSDLLNGTFDDVIMAFQQIENFPRRQAMGPYAHAEYFQQTGASAYTLDEWFSLLQAMWDTRGYNGIQLSFDDGYPYKIGKDIFIGILASFAATGLGLTAGTGSSSHGSTNLYTDYVGRITLHDDTKERRKVTVMIGDGKSHDDPYLKLERKVLSFEQAFQIVTLSAQSGG